MAVYYYGSWRGAGHHLFDRDGFRCGECRPPGFPIGWGALDGGLLPPGEPQVEGRATLTHVNDWTVLSFWDRSGDARPGSNSAFIVRGTHGFDAMAALGQAAFPTVWARFGFAVTHRPS